ncbi:MAG TPA: right-handed parallel beta-helix repeat-containing protein [Myxococcales bacterium]|jgi:hypothetical protein
MLRSPWRLGALAALALAACPTPSTGSGADAATEDAATAPWAPDAGRAACAAGSMVALDGGCVPVGWTQCGPGFEPDPSGWGCLDVQPEGDCPAATMPALGQRDCQPVGPATCPEGFAPDPSGWGCREVLPAVACTGATMEILGQLQCQPIGDCLAPFPPAGATVFVDAAFADAQLDATHFRTISAALQAAPAGAVVAVESGTYAESLLLDRAVSLVGRCAEKVILDGAGGALPGLEVRRDATVRGLTLRDQRWGILVVSGAQLLVDQCLLEANRGIGLRVEGGSGGVHSLATIQHSVVRGTLPDQGTMGHGVVAAYGGQVDLESSVVAGNVTAGVDVLYAGTDQVKSRGKVVRSIVRDTQAKANGTLGVGLEVVGASLEVRQSAVLASHSAGVSSTKGAEATVVGSVIRETGCAAAGCAELVVTAASRLVLEGSTVVGQGVEALWVDQKSDAALTRSALRVLTPCASEENCSVAYADDASLAMDGTALVGGGGAGLWLAGSHATLASCLVRDTVLGSQGQSYGIEVEGPSTLEAGASAVVNAVGQGVRIFEGSGVLTGSIVASTRSSAAQVDLISSGINVPAAGSLTLAGSAVVGNAGWGLVVGGNARVATTVVRDSVVDSSGHFGRGIQVGYGGSLDLQYGLLLRNREVGLAVYSQGSTLKASHLVVRGTLPDAANDLGFGVVVIGHAAATLEASAVVDCHLIGIGAADASALTVRASLVAGTTAGDWGGPGNGLIANVGSVLRAEDCQVRDTDGAALVVAGASASASRCVVNGNVTAVHVQTGSSLAEAEVPPEGPGALQVLVDPWSIFYDNVTRVGAGIIPLPSLPDP